MVVDTTFVIDLMREQGAGRIGPALGLLRNHRAAKLRMPVFVLCELELGALRSNRSEIEQARILRLTEFLEVVYPQPGFAAIYAGAVAKLLDAGTPVPVIDALIASVAIQYSEPLMTRDRLHFDCIAGLVVESY